VLTTRAAGTTPRLWCAVHLLHFRGAFTLVAGERTVVVETPRWWRLACGWSLAIAIGASVSGVGALDLTLPNKTDSFKFAVIGDFGTGDRPSYEVAAQMAALRARFPFEMVITTGDNIIGDQDDPSDLAEKFERPFGPLLDAGVRFFSADRDARTLKQPDR
jgi:hypothetical protein